MAALTLTRDTVPAYVASRPALANRVDASTLSVRELNSGHINFVFSCRDARGRSLCLKQFPPYSRAAGPSWSLPTARAAAEAHAYSVASQLAPELVPECYAFDPEHSVLAIEDLSGWSVLRSALCRGTTRPGVGEALGRYVARMTFGTSAFGLRSEAVRRAAAAAINPGMCALSESLMLTEPFIAHPHNSYPQSLAVDVARICSDSRVLDCVGELKQRFQTVGEALIHGDLHTGSVMLAPGSGAVGAGSVKVIDAEFSSYGPVGFDLGLLFGHYLLADARARASAAHEGFRRSVASLTAQTWSAFVAELRTRWQARADPTLSDGFLARWLQTVWRDAVGYAGCEAIRRIVNLAKARDITTLDEPESSAAARFVLRTGREWIVKRDALADPPALLEVEERLAETALAAR